MANEWIASGNGACYDSASPGFSIVQLDRFEIGLYYIVKVTILGMTQGKLVLDSIEGKPEFTEDGEYVINGKAIQTSLSFTGQLDGYSNVFDGCIDDVESHWTPLYRIEDNLGNIVFEQANNEDVQIANNNIQYAIDWNEIPLGTYKIKFTDGSLEYETYCICIKIDPCTILLSWTNDENAGGFNYSDLDFTQHLRVDGKLRFGTQDSIQRDIFRYSDGSKELLYSESEKVKELQIARMPEYLHDALAIGKDHDHFYIEITGTVKEYLVKTDDYKPRWRKSSNLAEVVLEVTPSNDSFINQNCR